MCFNTCVIGVAILDSKYLPDTSKPTVLSIKEYFWGINLHIYKRDFSFRSEQCVWQQTHRYESCTGLPVPLHLGPSVATAMCPPAPLPNLHSWWEAAGLVCSPRDKELPTWQKDGHIHQRAKSSMQQWMCPSAKGNFSTRLSNVLTPRDLGFHLPRKGLTSHRPRPLSPSQQCYHGLYFSPPINSGKQKKTL